jgi:hypothetical protein
MVSSYGGTVSILSDIFEIMDEQRQNEIVQEVEALCIIHQRITRSSECREFNRRAAQLLQLLEDTGCVHLADRAMDLLASCNPKDLSHCDSIERARYALMRLRYEAKRDLDKAARE